MNAIPGAGAIRVMLVDDHAGIRDGLRSILSSYPNFQVVGEAGDGEEACHSVEKLNPSVIVMDINMPRLNGIHATACIKKLFPHIIIVGLSLYAHDAEMHHAMTAAGASAVIAKDRAVQQLPHQILESVNRQSGAAH